MNTSTDFEDLVIPEKVVIDTLGVAVVVGRLVVIAVEQFVRRSVNLVLWRGCETKFEPVKVVDDFFEGVEQRAVRLVHDDEIKEKRRNVIFLFVEHIEHGVICLNVNAPVEWKAFVIGIRINRWFTQMLFECTKSLGPQFATVHQKQDALCPSGSLH